MTRRLMRATGVVALLVALLGACGGSNQVGNNALLNVKDQINKNRLGERETTLPASATTAPTVPNLAVRPSTTKPSTVPTVVHEQLITINADTSTAQSQFDPNTANVYPNYPVRFLNRDTVPRSVVFVNGDNRRSPAIAPGQSWTTTFAGTGTYNYQDGTRPYAVGTLTVVPRP